MAVVEFPIEFTKRETVLEERMDMSRTDEPSFVFDDPDEMTAGYRRFWRSLVFIARALMVCFVLMLLYVAASEVFAHFQNGHVESPILSPDGGLAVHVEYAPETLLWRMHTVVKLEELPHQRFSCKSELLDSRSLRWSDIRMTWTENNVLRLEYPDAAERTLHACGAIVHIVPGISN